MLEACTPNGCRLDGRGYCWDWPVFEALYFTDLRNNARKYSFHAELDTWRYNVTRNVGLEIWKVETYNNTRSIYTLGLST